MMNVVVTHFILSCFTLLELKVKENFIVLNPILRMFSVDC